VLELQQMVQDNSIFAYKILGHFRSSNEVSLV